MTRAERIIEARRRCAAGEFDRAVVANEPYDLRANRLTLECGHWTSWLHELVQVAPDRQTCAECAAAWINAEVQR